MSTNDDHWLDVQVIYAPRVRRLVRERHTVYAGDIDRRVILAGVLEGDTADGSRSSRRQ